MAWSAVLFNSVDITLLPGVEVHSIDHHKRPKRDSNRQKLARAQGSKLINAEYDERDILIRGVIRGTSRADYETNRDTFFRYLDVQEGVLRIPQSSTNRDYYCTVDDIDFSELPQGGLAEFIVRFVASNPPFGLDTSTTTPVNTTRSGSSATENFGAIGGSANALPLITVTLNSGTGLTSKYIKIMNPSSGKFITVTRTWTAADVLVIDCENKTVKVNGTAVDYTGAFPEFTPTDTQLYREDSFTTRSITVAMSYKKRWL